MGSDDVVARTDGEGQSYRRILGTGPLELWYASSYWVTINHFFGKVSDFVHIGFVWDNLELCGDW
jgi:hypothetical protein